MKRYVFATMLALVGGLIARPIRPVRLAAQISSALSSGAIRSAQEGATSVWGGQHIEIDMNSNGAEIEFDCAEGTVSAPLKVDAQGRFQADGTYTQEHGGPIRQGEKGSVAAKYSGWITGDTMHLKIVLVQNKESVAAFVLTRGNRGRVVKCR